MSNSSLEPKYATKLIKNVRIPLPDGISLSAELHLPDAPGRFPAVLNYIPYRKEDVSAYTASVCDYFAMRGFAGAIVLANPKGI
jgi:predicted acyl esterase